MIVKPDAMGVLASVKAQAGNGQSGKGPPPLHLWNPPWCGEIDIRILRDGTWMHEGRPITRPAMVQMFASILRREGERYVLVTPVEKVGIQVEDAPFVAVDVDAAGQGDAQVLTFETQVGTLVEAGPDHPVRVARAAEGAPAPYVVVRDGLEALIDRKTWMRLVDLGEHGDIDGTPWFGVRSNGAFFAMIPSADLG